MATALFPTLAVRARSVWLSVMLICAVAATARPQAGDPVDASGEPPDVMVTPAGAVELHVSDVPLSTVLRLLSLKGQRNIVASPKVGGKVTADLYGVTFEEALEAILVSNGAGYRRVGNFIYVHTQKELDDLQAARTGRPITRVFKLNYISAAAAQPLVAAILGDAGSLATSPAAATGLSSSATEAGGDGHADQDFLVITAMPTTMQAVADLIATIDVRPKQILVEATILRAELSDENSLGIDFALVGGVDLELLGGTSQAITDLTLGQLPTERFELFNATAQTDLTGNVPDGGITVGIIKDHVALFVRALEEITDTVVVANPKVLALNKQKGQVIVGRRDGYLTTTITETQAVQTVEFLETGTQLIFRPFIGDDGFIRVELHPEDSVGFISAQGLPSEQTTEITTNVILRDGETILIGGLFREVTTTVRSQVPGLGGLPLIGPLFRSQTDASDREEVIILLTIHVVKDQTVYAEASKEQMAAAEKLRVGMRQGLMWHGRDRIAQSYYRRAVAAEERDELNKAVWYANLALHNLPTFMPAIRMQERILGERPSFDGTGGRDFVERLLSDNAGTNP